MNTPRTVMMEITLLEAAHLSGLVQQFRDLLRTSAPGADGETDGVADPALTRLAPDAYPDDPDASAQFHDLTASDLLARRDQDAQVVQDDLPHGPVPDGEAALETATIILAPAHVEAWLRTLAALRLVLASRLGIRDEADHDDGDPRFGIYEWLGYRLEGLVQAADEDA